MARSHDLLLEWPLVASGRTPVHLFHGLLKLVCLELSRPRWPPQALQMRQMLQRCHAALSNTESGCSITANVPSTSSSTRRLLQLPRAAAWMLHWHAGREWAPAQHHHPRQCHL